MILTDNLSQKERAEKYILILGLDFTQMKLKLMDSTEGQGWNKEECDQIETLYKNFLYLILKNPKQLIIPTKQIDTFWRAHILDTQRYPADCQAIFGRFLHHNPYFGLGSEEEKKKLEGAYQHTLTLWRKEFGSMPFIGGDEASLCGPGSDCTSEPDDDPR